MAMRRSRRTRLDRGEFGLDPAAAFHEFIIGLQTVGSTSRSPHDTKKKPSA
jgi:hypothetical protein